MPGDDFKVDFTGDDRDLIKVIERQEKRIDQLEAKLKKAGETGKKGAESIGAAFEKGGKQIAGMVTGLFTAERAIGLVISAYQEWETRVVELGRKEDEAAKKRLGYYAQTNQLGRRNAAAAALQATGVPSGAATDIASAVYQAAPDRSEAEKAAIARQAAGLSLAGYDGAAMGRRMGDLSDTGRGAGDIADLAVGLQNILGDKAAQQDADTWPRMLKVLMAKGLSPERALAYMASGATSDVATKALAGAAGESKNAAAFERMMGDPRRLARLMPGATGDQLKLISPAAVAANEQALLDAQRNDAATRARAQAAGTPEGMRALLLNQQALQAERSQQIGARRFGNEIGDQNAFIDSFSQELNPVAGYLLRKRFAFNRGGDMARGVGAADAGRNAMRQIVGQDLVDAYEKERQIAEQQLKVLERIDRNLEVQGSRSRGVVPENRHGEN